MRWSDFLATEDFGLPELELKRFLEEQDRLWSKEFCEDFLKEEYGEVPKESPFVIIPQNVPHLLFQELRLAEVAGWKPTFYISQHLPKTKEFAKALSLNIIDKIPLKFPHVRSYGKNKLSIEARFHVFHGPWISYTILEDENQLEKLSELNGRGCLSPTFVFGDLKMLQNLEVKNDFRSFDYTIKALIAAQVVKEALVFGKTLVVHGGSAKNAHELSRNLPTPATGRYYTCHDFENFLKLERVILNPCLEEAMTTIPEKVIINLNFIMEEQAGACGHDWNA